VVPAGSRSFINYTPVKVSQSDIRAVVRGELTQLQAYIRKALPTTRDTLTRYHLNDSLVRIDTILNPKK
jgi:hypothetical protein